MTYSSEVLADTPILYWKLNETSGTSIADSSGNGKTGTIEYGTINTDYMLNQASLVDSDPANGCFAFTYWNPAGSMPYACMENITNFANLGGRSRIVRAYDSALDFGGTGKNFSVEYWFKTPIIQTWGPVVVGRRDTIVQWAGSVAGIYVIPRTDVAPAPGFWTGASIGAGAGMWSASGIAGEPTQPFSGGYKSWGITSPLAPPIFLADNQPHHFVGTYNASTGTITAYIDGVLWQYASLMNGANTPNIVANGTDYFIVGCRSRFSGGAGQEGYIGYLGHVAIYNTALSQARILAHYYAGKSKIAGLHMGYTLTAAPQGVYTESLAFTDSAVCDYQPAGNATETLNLADTAICDIGIGSTVTESLALSDTPSGAMGHSASIADGLAFTDPAAALRQLDSSVTDSIQLQTALNSSANFVGIITDGINLHTGLDLANDPVFALAINVENNATSVYDGFNFTSMARVGGRYFGVSEAGLCELTGDTDDNTPIQAMINLGTNDAESPNLKSYQDIYIGAKSADKLLMKTIVGADEYIYEAHTNAETIRECRVQPGRGLKATYWQFELWNKDGADFELASVEFHPVLLSRRV